ncbi:MAG TPA: hypothetical protein VGO01_23650 [Bradyrhizobium sp.]|nr:hypothetical protein [Bradyrhizobium sp.]
MLHNTAVILRCSPFFTASLEGSPTSTRGPSFETPRKRAAPQDDGLNLLTFRIDQTEIEIIDLDYEDYH